MNTPTTGITFDTDLEDDALFSITAAEFDAGQDELAAELDAADAAFAAAAAAKVARDAANDELRRAWDIEDAVGPNDASDREIERLRIRAANADDAFAAAKADAVAAWKAAGWPLNDAELEARQTGVRAMKVTPIEDAS